MIITPINGLHQPIGATAWDLTPTNFTVLGWMFRCFMAH
jgi:hypothetical protein